MDPILVAHKLHVRHGEHLAVAGVSLALEPGEVVAVVGESGAGKTSLLHCLSGLTTPDEGSVLFKGRAIGDLTVRQRDALRRQHFGFVFQFGDLVPELSVEENVSLPLRLQGVAAGEARRKAVARLEALGIGGLARRGVGEVSGGELQRAAIARSMVHDPDVVFADEPTGALDDENSAVVFGLMLDQARQRGAAVVVVTHDRNLAAQADRRVVLHSGRTAGAG